MLKKLIPVMIGLIAITIHSTPNQNPQQQVQVKHITYLRGGQLIDGSGKPPISNALVVIKGEQVVYAGKIKPLPHLQATKTIDCSGKSILPGLIDAHIHLGGSATLGYIYVPDQRKLSAYLFCGVTSVFDLAAVPETAFALRQAVKNNTILSPRFFTVGPCFTSPGGHGTEYGVPMSITPVNEKEARQGVRQLVKKQPDMVKIIYENGSKHFSSLSYQLMETIIDEAHHYHFKVVTHISTLDQAKDAIRAGSNGLAHMIQDEIIDSSLMEEMKNNDIFCIPTLSVFESFAHLAKSKEFLQQMAQSPLLPQGVCREIWNQLKASDSKQMSQHLSEKWQKSIKIAQVNLKKMADSGIQLVLGTDAGNPYVLFGPAVHRELQLMVEAGLSPMQAIVSATRNAADILGCLNQIGTIAQGKLADILVVDGNPLENIKNTENIDMVIKNGVILNRSHLARSINPPPMSNLPPQQKRSAKVIKATTDYPRINLDQQAITQINKGKEVLKKGLDTWNPSLLKKSRDMFLNLLVNQETINIYTLYYLALTDYRLTTFYLAGNEMEEAEKFNAEAKKYLEKAISLETDFAEIEALYASTLGYEIALHPERAMVLGIQSSQHLNKALKQGENNPRINYLQGISLLYTPPAFGGGADKALPYLHQAISLYASEKPRHSIHPSWGYDEACTFLALAYKGLKKTTLAKEYLKKALTINPGFGMARDELNKIQNQ